MKFKYGKVENYKKRGFIIQQKLSVRSFRYGSGKKKYGNLFDMYEQITGVNPYKNPMMIYPAVHYYTMGGLWVDYNLMTTVLVCML